MPSDIRVRACEIHLRYGLCRGFLSSPSLLSRQLLRTIEPNSMKSQSTVYKSPSSSMLPTSSIRTEYTFDLHSFGRAEAAGSSSHGMTRQFKRHGLEYHPLYFTSKLCWRRASSCIDGSYQQFTNLVENVWFCSFPPCRAGMHAVIPCKYNSYTNIYPHCQRETRSF